MVGLREGIAADQGGHCVHRPLLSHRYARNTLIDQPWKIISVAQSDLGAVVH